MIAKLFKGIIRVIERDRVGLLADITKHLEKSGVLIYTVSVDLVADKAVVALGVSDVFKAKEHLASAGYCVLEH